MNDQGKRNRWFIFATVALSATCVLVGTWYLRREPPSPAGFKVFQTTIEGVTWDGTTVQGLPEGGEVSAPEESFITLPDGTKQPVMARKLTFPESATRQKN